METSKSMFHQTRYGSTKINLDSNRDGVATLRSVYYRTTTKARPEDSERVEHMKE